MTEGKLAKEALEDVLNKARVNEIWSSSCPEVIPFTIQGFSVGGVLPAVMYMFRRGVRRGNGNFRRTFAPDAGAANTLLSRKNTKLKPSITSIVDKLVSSDQPVIGFSDSVGRAILGDLLLCHCLENQRHQSGRDHALIRAFPTHYMSAWLDLPESVVHLRMVPETIVAILRDQRHGEWIDPLLNDQSWFGVNTEVSENSLLKAFSSGMKMRAKTSGLVDDFDEASRVGIDQLLTVRLAHECGAAPTKVAVRQRRVGSDTPSGSSISNQRPLAEFAARTFNEDCRLFLQGYSQTIPRKSLSLLLEACICLGLTNILLSTSKRVSEWASEDRVAPTSWPLFVDASSSTDRSLRRFSEESMDDSIRRLRRVPIVFMAIRSLNYKSRMRLGDELPTASPNSNRRLEMLADILHQRHAKSDRILDDLEEACRSLSEQLSGVSGCESVVSLLNKSLNLSDAVWALAEGVTLMMGDGSQMQPFNKCLSSCMMIDEPNGLAVQRTVKFRDKRNGKKSGILRSIVLTNTMLDFLVHRHLCKPGKRGQVARQPRSFTEFLRILRERYGLFVDVAPPGQSISVEVLLRNRQILENRLRDLGLLVGVNDAESMKRLRPRFNLATSEEQS